MAKSSTIYDSAGLSKDSSKQTRKNNSRLTQPSDEALSFVLNYAKSSTVLKSKSINTILLVNN